MRYGYDRYGNIINSSRDPNGPALNQAILTFASCVGGVCEQNRFSSTSWMGVLGGSYDANGNTTAYASQLATQAGATWTALNRMDTYYEAGMPWTGGTPGQRYLYDASGFRVVRWDVGTTGKPLITLRGPDGTALADFEARPGGGGPALVRDMVHGLGRVLVEREVTNPAPTATAGSPLSSGTSYNLDVDTGTGSYTLDVQTRSGWSNLQPGLVADSAGRIAVPEADLSPGETNLLRFRKETPTETGYSAPVTVAFDPTVNASSPNQVRSIAVSRSGNDIVLRWSVLNDNGKKFRVYFRPKAGGTTVLVTPQALLSTTRAFTLSSQALATGCLEFFIRQWTVQGETADGPHTDLGPPLPGTDGRAQDPCDPGAGGGGGGGSPSAYTFLEHFQIRDHVGSLRVITDEAGAVEEKLDFYPFGQEISFGSVGEESERKYTGHQRDGRTGLDYMMARYKAPWLGSFQSPDPINDVSFDVPWSWNKYAYVRGNPITGFDPLGLENRVPEIGPVDCNSWADPEYCHSVSADGIWSGRGIFPDGRNEQWYRERYGDAWDWYLSLNLRLLADRAQTAATVIKYKTVCEDVALEAWVTELVCRPVPILVPLPPTVGPLAPPFDRSGREPDWIAVEVSRGRWTTGFATTRDGHEVLYIAYGKSRAPAAIALITGYMASEDSPVDLLTGFSLSGSAFFGLGGGGSITPSFARGIYNGVGTPNYGGGVSFGWEVTRGNGSRR